MSSMKAILMTQFYLIDNTTLKLDKHSYQPKELGIGLHCISLLSMTFILSKSKVAECFLWGYYKNFKKKNRIWHSQKRNDVWDLQFQKFNQSLELVSFCCWVLECETTSVQTKFNSYLWYINWQSLGLVHYWTLEIAIREIESWIMNLDDILTCFHVASYY